MKSFKFIKICIILIPFFPFIFISLLGVIVKIGTIYVNTNEIIIDLQEAINIGDYISYYVAIVGIEVTVLFSYMLYRTSVTSNELSKSIIDKEENRDKEKTKESALIVYYNLLSNLSTLKMLYTKHILNNDLDVNTNIIVLDDWIMNIANLRHLLSKKELDELFQLYSKFELISKSNLDGIVDNYDLIRILSEEIFIEPLLKYLCLDYTGAIEALLNYKYYSIFNKIEREFNGNKSSSKFCFGKISNGTIIDGTESWIGQAGDMRYTIVYKDGNLFYTKYMHLLNENWEKIIDGIYQDKKLTGQMIEFYPSKRIHYKGSVKEGKYNGKGVMYKDTQNNQILFNGVWDKGRKLEGEYFGNESEGIIYFKGEYRRGRPYSGKIKTALTYEIDNKCYGYKGDILKGKPFNGIGYKEKKRIYDDEYLQNHPEYNPELEYDIEDYLDYPEDYDEIQQEMMEDRIRDEKRFEFEQLKEDYGEVIELLEGEWKSGIYTGYPEDLLYKEYFPIVRSKKK